MPLFRHPIPRRALVGAALGLLYSFAAMPDPESFIGIRPEGVAWFLLSIGLLFLVPLAYHAFTLFGLGYVVYEIVLMGRNGFVFAGLVDIVVPAAAVALVMTSGYLREAQDVRAADDLAS